MEKRVRVATGLHCWLPVLSEPRCGRRPTVGGRQHDSPKRVGSLRKATLYGEGDKTRVVVPWTTLPLVPSPHTSIEEAARSPTRRRSTL